MTLSKEDSELRRLLAEFTRRIPEVGIGEARNELEEKLEARDEALEAEARKDELKKLTMYREFPDDDRIISLELYIQGRMFDLTPSSKQKEE